MSTNYKGLPIVAYSDDRDYTRWMTPDGVFRISLHKSCPIDKDCYTVAERHLSRLGDSHMHVLWYDVLAHVDRSIVKEALNVILYPYGSEPSPEYAGVGNDPRTTFDPEPAEWVTPDQYFGGDES